jgi:putative endonuclease
MITAYTYILQCANHQYYVGSTTDLDRRLQEHQAGLGAKFTRAHLPIKLVYKEEYSSIEMAFARERQLHGWSRAKKEALIKGQNDSLRSLSLSKGRASIDSQALREPQ